MRQQVKRIAEAGVESEVKREAGEEAKGKIRARMKAGEVINRNSLSAIFWLLDLVDIFVALNRNFGPD